MSNVVDLIDQSAFRGERATGATNLLQCVWAYNRAIDIDGLRQFHQHLQRGRLSRRIERSPLPFGRHHWVSPNGQSDLEIVATPRPREEFDAWLSEQASTPLDAEHGPGWHLAMVRFTDGGAGVSLVVPHTLTDGVGLCEALADAASGRHDPISWPAAAVTPAAASAPRGRRAKPRATSRLSAAPSLPRHNSRGVTATVTGPAPSYPARRKRRSSDRTNASLSQRRRSSSTPMSGMPAHTHSGGPATRYSPGWRPASPSEWDGSPGTASPPWRYPLTSAPTAILAPTPSPVSTSRSTLQLRQRICAGSGPQSSKR